MSTENSTRFWLGVRPISERLFLLSIQERKKPGEMTAGLFTNCFFRAIGFHPIDVLPLTGKWLSSQRCNRRKERRCSHSWVQRCNRRKDHSCRSYRSTKVRRNG